MNWKKITSDTKFPKDKAFLLYDSHMTSGTAVYEAMVFDDGTIGCTSSTETFNINEFSHWCDIIHPNESTVENKQGLTIKITNDEILITR